MKGKKGKKRIRNKMKKEMKEKKEKKETDHRIAPLGTATRTDKRDAGICKQKTPESKRCLA